MTIDFQALPRFRKKQGKNSGASEGNNVSKILICSRTLLKVAEAAYPQSPISTPSVDGEARVQKVSFSPWTASRPWTDICILGVQCKSEGN